MHRVLHVAHASEPYRNPAALCFKTLYSCTPSVMKIQRAVQRCLTQLACWQSFRQLYVKTKHQALVRGKICWPRAHSFNRQYYFAGHACVLQSSPLTFFVAFFVLAHKKQRSGTSATTRGLMAQRMAANAVYLLAQACAASLGYVRTQLTIADLVR